MRDTMTSSNTSARLPRVPLVHVHTPQGYAGTLVKSGQHTFSYHAGLVREQDLSRAISICMPVRSDPYRTTPLLPVFQTSLPEGYLLDRMRADFASELHVDDMGLIALSGITRIGRLLITQTPEDFKAGQSCEKLSAILLGEDKKHLFDELAFDCIRYGISGVQPKLLVFAADDCSSSEQNKAIDPSWSRSSEGVRKPRTLNLILKVGTDQHPGLAENEFYCLEIGRRCGLEVPRTWLSEDATRFIIERFDIDSSTDALRGFEDIVSITGRFNANKYQGSYELIAKTISNLCSLQHKSKSLLALFKIVALSVILRNGDAHLKNFGLLYTDPSSDDIRLAPAYDLVCTTVYLKNDQLALSLGKSKHWPSRATLIDFGQRHCGVDQADAIIEEMLNTALDFRPEVDRTGIWKSMRLEIQKAASSMLPNGAPIPPRYLPEDSGGPPLR